MSTLKNFFNREINGTGLYLIAFSFCLVISFIFTTTFTDYFHTRPLQLLSYLGIGLVLVKIYLLDNYNYKQLSGISILLFFSFISWRHSQSNTQSNLILYMMVFILGAKDVEFKKIVEVFYKISLIMMLGVILYSLLGIITNLAYFTPGRPIRYALGMLYPTDMASHILFLILAKCYLVFPNIKWYHYSIFLLLALFMKVVADARLSAYTTVLLVIIMFIAERAQKGNKLCKILASFYWTATPLLAFIATVTALNFDMNNHIMRKVNDLLSGRLLLSYQAFQRYGISLFGEPVIEHGSGGIKGMKMFFNQSRYFYIDSSFIRLFIIYGILMFLIFLAFMMIIAIRSTYHHSYILPAIMFVVAISCLLEQHLLDLSFNPFLLSLLATNTYKWREKNEKSDRNSVLQ